MARSSIALLLLLTVASTAGYKCLFIGHSFFVPISRQLPDLAASAAGVTHEQSEVFSGGASGAPSQMWESDQKRNATQTILDGGDIELFGMTLDGGAGAIASTTEGYENWMDYALSKNPSTMFMIGAPWPDFPQDYDTATYTANLRGNYTTLDGIFASLRANPKYLGVTIIENPYALAVIEARLLYEAGGIPDVSSLFGGCDEDVTGESLCGDAFFNDYKGHGGEFLQNLAALVWLNRIYNVDLSVYNSPALSQFTTDMPAVAKAVLDAFDAGNFCGTSTCSTCNVTTPCGVPPVIEPTGCLGDCNVYMTLTIARTISEVTPAFLEVICGMITDAATVHAAPLATCTVREGDDARYVFIDATLDTFIQGSGQTVQKVMNKLNRTLNRTLPGWVKDVTVDTTSPSPLPLPSPPPPSPSPPPPSPSPPPPSPPACVDTKKKKCKNKHCKDLEKKKACKKTCGLCEPLPPSAPPSPSLPTVNCGGLSDDEACKIKIKKCEKNPPKSMNKCKKKCKKDGKKTPPLCQKACCKLGFFTPA